MRQRDSRPSPDHKPRKPAGKPAWPRKGEHRRPQHSPRSSPRPLADGDVVLYGWHTVKAALENPARRIRKLYATENAARRLAEDGVSLAVEAELVRPDAI